MFANSPGDRDSIPGWVIPKTKNWHLMQPCLTLSIIRYGSRVNGSNPKKGVAPFPTPRCSSYWKGSLRVALDYGRQLLLIVYACLNNITLPFFSFIQCKCLPDILMLISDFGEWKFDYLYVVASMDINRRRYFRKGCILYLSISTEAPML